MRAHALHEDMISIGPAAAAHYCLHFVFRWHLQIRFGDVSIFNLWSCPGLTAGIRNDRNQEEKPVDGHRGCCEELARVDMV